ncbi:hypothetical protein CR513_44022, partial [Mucuna pruriens]
MGVTNAKEAWSTLQEEFDQMRAYGENILDKKIVDKILIFIPYKCLYKQKINRHNEDSVENVFQSKFKSWSQNKKRGKNYRNKKNFRSFSKNNQDKYPPYDICKKTSHLQNNCWHRRKP